MLWGLPPSFCSLVQRAGRAGCDFSTLREAILIVPLNIIKNGTKEAEVEAAVQEAADDVQAENRGEDEKELLDQNGVEVTSSNEQVLVNDGGVRAEQDSEPEEEPQDKPKRWKKFTKNDSNSLEVHYLTLFACASRCLRVIWDEFFGNAKKSKCPGLNSFYLKPGTHSPLFAVQLVYPTTTTYQSIPDARCCHVCEPRLFPMENIELEKLPGLKQENKRKVSEEQESAICNDLIAWQEDELLDKIYPGTSSISEETVLGDDVIEKLASYGERIETLTEMRRHVCWAIGFDENTGYSTTYGDLLLAKLQSIYAKFDDAAAAAEACLTALCAMPREVDPTNFYATSTQSRSRRTAAVAT